MTVHVDRTGVWLLVGSLVVGVLSSSAHGTLEAHKKCYLAQCGGYLDQVCTPGSGACSYCSGGTARNQLCFNKPGALCDTIGGSTTCGVIAEGTCQSNGYCGQSSNTNNVCQQAVCTGGGPPPPPPPAGV